MRKHGFTIRCTSLIWLISCAGILPQPIPAAGQTEAIAPNQEIASEVVNGTSGQRNSLVPGISLTTQALSGSAGAGVSGHMEEGYLMGHLTLRRFTGQSAFLLDYSGGNSFSSGLNRKSAPVQALEVSEARSGRRWTFSLGGTASYLPESSFGFGWAAGFKQPSVVTPTTDTTAGTPGQQSAPIEQTILTAQVQRLSGMLRTGLEYRTSERSSWSVSGSYGRLEFKEPGYVDSSTALLQASYAHQVSRRDTISILYGFDDVRFAGQSQAIGDHNVSLSLARRVSSKLSLRVAAGPALSTFQSALAGASSQISYRVSSGVNYLTDRGSLELSYDRFLTAGSGVLLGAKTNQLQLTAGRFLARAWQSSLAVGYAANRGLAQTRAGAAQTPLQSWYGDVKLSRHIGPSIIFVGYGVRSQNSSGICTAPGCGFRYLTHQISLGLNWNARPIDL
jgi:hypothetical protein